MSEEEKTETPELPDKEPEIPQVETEAREQGWLPEEEFKAAYPDKKWRDAEDFVERGEFMNRIKSLDYRNRTQEKKLSKMAADVGGMKEAFAIAKEAERKRARREIMAERDQAVKDEDSDKAAELETRLDELNETPKAPDQKDEISAEEERIQQEWADKNKWFATEPELQAHAMSYAAVLMKNNKDNLIGMDFLDKVAEETKKRYPEKFPDEQKRTPPKVGAARHGASGDVDISSLPQEYKDALKVYSDMGKDPKTIIKQWQSIGAIP